VSPITSSLGSWKILRDLIISLSLGPILGRLFASWIGADVQEWQF
jgi:hypothetical protein